MTNFLPTNLMAVRIRLMQARKERRPCQIHLSIYRNLHFSLQKFLSLPLLLFLHLQHSIPSLFGLLFPLLWLFFCFWPALHQCAAMAYLRPNLHLILLAVSLSHAVIISSRSDIDILLSFRDSLTNNGALSNWNASVSPCNGSRPVWKGILCSSEGYVWGLQLQNMGFQGKLDVDILAELPSLGTISFMHNSFEGSLPDLKKLSRTKTIYLSNNKFSGEIPMLAFEKMDWLKKLHLSNNQFSGAIPSSLAKLPRLKELMLDGNQFDGSIPNFPIVKFTVANFSNNDLEGQIPDTLKYLSASSFSGNEGLCGNPLQPCPAAAEISIAAIIAIVVVLTAALAAIVVAIIILHRRKKVPPEQENHQTAATSQPGHHKAASADLDKMEKGSQSGSTDGKKAEQLGRLVLLMDDRERFDLPDLLRASAEVLGSGVFGSTYKAALSNGNVMVVKRYRQMNNVGKEEFQEHMRRLGRLRHPNLLPLVAYYYRKEEKLFVADFVENRSLAAHLHGNHNHGNPSLDWPTRLKIVKGVARGLLNLYSELPNLVVPHGHLKSSNILLTKSYEPLLNDYGLAPITNQENAHDLMIAYKSPEYKQHGRITKKTDVWSFGILILETLTGKFPPTSFQGKGSDADLAAWVSSVVGEEVTKDVFDKDMKGYNRSHEGEIIKLLKIGLSCCEVDVEKRLDIKEVVDRIEEVKEKDS